MSERLEEIRKHFAYCMDEGLLFAEQEEKLLEELYEQAERVEELENVIKSHAPHGRNYTNKQYVDLLQQNKRYREVIEKIKGFPGNESEHSKMADVECAAILDELEALED